MSCSITEQECVDFLIKESKLLGELSPRCVVVNRMQTRNSLTRTVRFALVVTTNNLTLIDGLNYKCMDFSDEMYFVGSEVNFQQDLDVDYLYFEAKIIAKKG